VDDPAVRAWYVKNGFRQSSEHIYVRHEHKLRVKTLDPLADLVVTA
jgi:hypothetical protein